MDLMRWRLNPGVTEGLVCTNPSLNGGLLPDFFPEVQRDGQTWFQVVPPHELSGRTLHVTPDKLTVRLDTSADPANIAVNHSWCFKYQTWPHAIAECPIEELHRWPVRLTVQEATNLGGHITPYPQAVLLLYVFLVHRVTKEGLWAGVRLFEQLAWPGATSIPTDPYIAKDQWGMTFVQFSPAWINGPLQVKVPRRVEFDLDFLVRSALAALGQSVCMIYAYDPQTLSLGWECLGNWRASFTVRSTNG